MGRANDGRDKRNRGTLPPDPSEQIAIPPPLSSNHSSNAKVLSTPSNCAGLRPRVTRVYFAMHRGRCRTVHFSTSESLKIVTVAETSRRVTAAYVSTGHSSRFCRATPRQCTPFLLHLLLQIPIHRLSLPSPLKNSRAASPTKRAANLSSIHNATFERGLPSGPWKRCVHASGRTHPGQKNSTTNHRHVYQCSIPCQRCPVPLMGC